MKNIIFEKLKKKFATENFENFETVYNVIWRVYENSPREFNNVCCEIFKIFNIKAYLLMENNKIIHFTDWNIPDDNLKKIIEVTSWNNITDVENHTVKVIDSRKVLPFDKSSEIENGVYIFRNYNLFEQLYHSLSKELNTIK